MGIYCGRDYDAAAAAAAAAADDDDDDDDDDVVVDGDTDYGYIIATIYNLEYHFEY